MENLELSRSFWNNKRVLVTGHTGFKGTWLSIWLQLLGARIAGYALPASTVPNFFELSKLSSSMQSEIGDLRDFERLDKFVSSFRPEIILHMAAQSLVRRSYSDPILTYGSNVMGTVHLLEAARRCTDVAAVVNVTSDKCYEDQSNSRGCREDDAMGGYDPYSSSKGCAELVTSAYRRSYFSGKSQLALASVRAGNVIGGGDWAEDRLVPDMVRAFSAERAAMIRNPQSVRPWQHVVEPLFAYLLLAERLAKDGRDHAEAWNFGPDNEDARPVAWLADTLCALWGPNARWAPAGGTSSLHESSFLTLDCSKARTRLGWKPALKLQDALAWTVAWYKGFAAGDDMRVLAESQIVEFELRQGKV